MGIQKAADNEVVVFVVIQIEILAAAILELCIPAASGIVSVLGKPFSRHVGVLHCDAIRVVGRLVAIIDRDLASGCVADKPNNLNMPVFPVEVEFKAAQDEHHAFPLGNADDAAAAVSAIIIIDLADFDVAVHFDELMVERPLIAAAFEEIRIRIIKNKAGSINVAMVFFIAEGGSNGAVRIL